MFKFRLSFLRRLMPNNPVFRAYGLMDKFTKAVLEERQLDPTLAANHHDFVSLLLEAKDPETGKGLTNEEILSSSRLFLLAGHDTTAGSIGCIIVYDHTHTRTLSLKRLI